MQGFLNEVAERLYNKYGSEISSIKLIFPSRRSRIFFTEALSQVAVSPLWQPTWVSLDELVAEATTLQRGESIRLTTELYRIYSSYHGGDFDRFYFWGEILLSDFDMIDKYMVDADMLFANVADIKEIESDISYMTAEQLKIIEFWRSFKDESGLSEERRKFLNVWRSLPEIYHKFRARLTELGIAYTGMMQRSAVERLASGDYSFDGEQRYAVVGFNALSECEKRIFDSLSHLTSVDFFWDYDSYYVDSQEQEAGLFIRENLSRYGSSFDISHNHFAKGKELNVVSAASNVLQCKYASKIISELSERGEIDKDTAIVLTDENLLTPLLYALPPQAGKVNVTMGYPLKQTLAYSLVERLLMLQTQARGRNGGNPQFYYVDVLALLAHPYINVIDKEAFAQIEKQIKQERLITVDRASILGGHSDHFATIFDGCNSWIAISQYLQRITSLVAQYPYQGDDSSRRLEFLATISDHISTLQNSIESCKIEISESIYISLLRRMLQALRVPFEGEPLEGLQVMGILETRNLDFRNVIILSMNDDTFPGNRLTTPSYVTYNIRAAYGVPTPEHHEGVFAYYFYRLIQRAERVWMLYCSHADDKTTGEASRYIYQLGYESSLPINYTNVGVDVNLYDSAPLEIEKVGEVDRILSQYTDPDNPRRISPSAINRYVACPMRFYLYHIANIRGGDDLTEDVDNSMFGNILHEAIHTIYQSFIGRGDTKQELHSLLKDRSVVEREVVAAIRKVCKVKESVGDHSFAGDLQLIKDIVIKYIVDGVVAFDTNSSTDFETISVEKVYDYTLELPSKERITIEGTLDRVDQLAPNKWRVIDYKTGGKHLEFKSIEALFKGEGAERQGHIIQTLTYSMMLYRTYGVKVVPSLYYVRFMNSPTYSPLLINKSSDEECIESYHTQSEEFESHLTATLAELLDRSIPFRQVEDKDGSCSYCDFRQICRV